MSLRDTKRLVASLVIAEHKREELASLEMSDDAQQRELELEICDHDYHLHSLQKHWRLLEWLDQDSALPFDFASLNNRIRGDIEQHFADLKLKGVDPWIRRTV